jgi:FkbH-like protein
MNPGAPESAMAVTTIAVAATFTAEPVEAALRFWMQELQVPAKITFAPYSQVFQQLVDPSSVFSGNHRGINVLLVRLEDLISDEFRRSHLEPPGDGGSMTGRRRDTPPNQMEGGDFERIDGDAGGFVSAVKGAVERAPTPYLVCFCPPSAATESSTLPLYRRIEDRITAALGQIPGVDVVTSAELTATYPVDEIFDPHGDRLAHIPYKAGFYTAVGTMIARRIYALCNAPYKVIAFDADQTLWNGVCGEDGPLGVEIDPSRRAIQEFLVRQHDAGMILCLCSKNNDEDVAAVFDRRPEMVLRREHIVGWRVNWRPKSENLRSLAGDLQLGLDSFIFLDDDPVACADVQANTPEVLAFVLPQDPKAIARFLGRIWSFDHSKVTKEAADRTAFYRQDSARRGFQMESLTLHDFLAGLGLKVQIAPMTSNYLVRAAELTQRTNQFNATTIRRSEAGLQSLLQPQGLGCLVVNVKDRFGEYGVVGVMIFSVGVGALVVDTFLLSCRALGRGVEHRMLARLGEIALQSGLAEVDVPFLPSRKNQPTLDFLESVGNTWKQVENDGFLFHFPADRAAGMRYEPPVRETTRDSSASRPAVAPARAAVDARAKAALLTSIATELWDAEQITTVITAQRRIRPDLDVPYLAPTTACEKQVAEMFGKVLGVEHVGINDDFFSLGGHSLLATMLIARLRDAFEVEIPIAVLFEADFTVAKAAQMVGDYQMQASPEGTTEALRRLIESLSEEEVRALSADQRGPVPEKSGGEKV